MIKIIEYLSAAIIIMIPRLLLQNKNSNPDPEPTLQVSSNPDLMVSSYPGRYYN